MTLRAVVKGIASALPRKCVSNSELPAELETSDEWIRGRTGIAQRYLVSDDESTASLAVAAAKAALADAGMDVDVIDLIIVSTSTPDLTMPSTACLVQSELGNRGAAAFDLNAACSGFVYGLSVANAMLQSGQAKSALVIGAETMSRIVDWSDRRTCVLFGDGAGAMVLQAEESELGILGCAMNSDGAFHPMLKTTGGISQTQQAGTLMMDGREVFRHAVDKMSSALESLLDQCGYNLEAIDWVVPHQANQRIIDAIARKTGVEQNKCIVTLDQHANTSAASIPLALAAAKADGRLAPGQILALPALGAGLTWGCCIIKL